MTTRQTADWYCANVTDGVSLQDSSHAKLVIRMGRISMAATVSSLFFTVHESCPSDRGEYITNKNVSIALFVYSKPPIHINYTYTYCIVFSKVFFDKPFEQINGYKLKLTKE